MTQTLKLGMSLAALDKPFGVIVFPGARHILREVAEERDRQATDFFKSNSK